MVSGRTLPYVESRRVMSTPRYSPYRVSGGSISISARVSSSAQSSTTTAMLASLSLNCLGSFLSAFSTSASNCRRVMMSRGCSSSRALEPAHAFDVDHVGNVPDRGHDSLELLQIRHFHHEVVDAAPVVGDRDFGLRDVPVLRGNGACDLRQQPGTVTPDVHSDADRTGRRLVLLDVPFNVDQPLPIEDALGHRQAVAGVDGEAAPAGDEADDLVTGERIATSGEANQQVVHAADADALLGLGLARAEPRLLGRLQAGSRRQLVEDLVHRAPAVTDRGQQVVDPGEAEVGGDLARVVAAQEGVAV